MKTEITDRFTVTNDAGLTFQAIKITEYTSFQPLTGPVQWRAGSYRFELIDGTHLNELDTGKVYETWETEERLRRV